MQDRQNHELPEQSASAHENTVSAQETTVAMRRKSVGINREADPSRLRLQYISAENGCHFAISQPHRRQGRHAACARHRVDRRLSGALSRELLRSQMAIN